MCQATSARRGTSAAIPASLSACAALTQIPKNSPTRGPACRHGRSTACASCKPRCGRTTAAAVPTRLTSNSTSTGSSLLEGHGMHEHGDHDHPHPHPGSRPDADDTLTYYKVMETAVRELLVEK